MTPDDYQVPDVPDWTRWATARHLNELQPGEPYMLRVSDESDSDWAHVKTRNQGFWTDKETGSRIDYITVEFHDRDEERLLNEDDPLEVGLLRPPHWPPDMEPPEWPR